MAGVAEGHGIRIRPAPGRGPDAFELVVEDRREAGDEVQELRGISFYLDAGAASALRGAVLDLDGLDFVFRKAG